MDLKKIRTSNLGVFLIALLLFSCSKQEESLLQKPYFDLLELIKNQEKLLVSRNPDILKTWINDGKSEKKKLKITDWEKELAIFASLDINKKGLIKSYLIVKNDSVEKYSLIAGEDYPVKQILVYRDSYKNVNSIKIESETNNFIFKSRTDSYLKLNKDLISEYSVTVNQKMFLGEGNTRKVTAQILQ